MFGFVGVYRSRMVYWVVALLDAVGDYIIPLVQFQSGALLDLTDLYVFGFVGVYRSRLMMRVMEG